MIPKATSILRTRPIVRASAAAAWVLALLPLSPIACTSGPEVTVTPLMAKPLADQPGKEGELLLVDYGPGAADPVHRHDAHAFVYVLDGSVVMQLRGSEEVTLTSGQTFYEGPDDVHVVGRNASSTQPARMLVFLVKERGAPVLVPEQPSVSEPPPTHEP